MELVGGLADTYYWLLLQPTMLHYTTRYADS